jgi:hypothetical protein
MVKLFLYLLCTPCQSRSYFLPCHQVKTRLPWKEKVRKLDVHVEISCDEGVRVYEGKLGGLSITILVLIFVISGFISLRLARAETVRSGKAYDCNVFGGRIPHVRLRAYASLPSLTSSSSGANYRTWTTHQSSTPSLWTLSSAWHTSA